LDAETEGALLVALRRLVAGRTTFVIAHRLSTTRLADRIVVLEDGGIAEAGSHDELMGRERALRPVPPCPARPAVHAEAEGGMRVLELCPLWFPVARDSHGGIETFLTHLVSALGKLGCEVTVLASGDSKVEAELLPAGRTTWAA
jgi:hypothetical protein